MKKYFKVVILFCLCTMMLAESDTTLYPPSLEKAVLTDALLLTIEKINIGAINDPNIEGRIFIEASLGLRSNKDNLTFDNFSNDRIFLIKINNNAFQHYAAGKLGSASNPKDWIVLDSNQSVAIDFNNAGIEKPYEKIDTITIKMYCNIKMKGKWGQYIIISPPFKIKKEP